MPTLPLTSAVHAAQFDHVGFNNTTRSFPWGHGERPPPAIKKKTFECARGGVPKLGAKMPWSSSVMMQVRIQARNEHITGFVTSTLCIMGFVTTTSWALLRV